MNDLVKKNNKSKHSFGKDGQGKTKRRFPTLAHIVLNNGSRVEIPKLPMNISELTSYDHLRIALEHAGLAILCLNRLETYKIPRLADLSNLEPIRMNLEYLMNHLYYAINVYPKEKGSS